ncbi:MAG: Membrane associated serine protease, rhomboid family [Pelagibacterales bacterium]|nr:Membrane associated serine protease, rhomboid family [Pelagibacterales bacterium]
MIPLKDDNSTSVKPIVTYFIIGTCILLFLIQLSSQSYKTGQLFYSYGLIPSVLMGHKQLPIDLYAIPSLLTIFTSMFVHGGFMHLIGNMLYMWIFADNIEDDLGMWKFIIFYFLCGFGAAMSQVLMDTHSQIPMVGASGAIGGILGAYLINYPKARVLVLIPFGFFSQLVKIKALYVLGFWFILQFINSVTNSSQAGGVAYAAHIGGFISGIVLILFFNKKKVKKEPWNK